jgi:hypothetical protein
MLVIVYKSFYLIAVLTDVKFFCEINMIM